VLLLVGSGPAAPGRSAPVPRSPALRFRSPSRPDQPTPRLASSVQALFRCTRSVLISGPRRDCHGEPPACPHVASHTPNHLASVTVMTLYSAAGRPVETDPQVRQAQIFASLHRPGDPLLLANAWDVGSAIAIVRAGAKAVATTSAGVAWSLGVPDAADLGPERAAAVVERIAGAVPVPVSADIEAGYGPGADAVAATVTAVVRAGAVGVNLEDRSDHADTALFTPTEQAERLAAARAAANRLGIPLWINARTDIFLAGVGPAEGRLDHALERAACYAAAGADSLFVPGLVDLDAIAELASGPLPVAVMVWPGAPTVADLASAGVVRVSLGSAIVQAAYALAARAATELLTAGTYGSLTDPIPYGAMNTAILEAAAKQPPVGLE
jgi:2-methylisocitrate lyase-like PEP mutase family enzyme